MKKMLVLLGFACALHAETGRDAWLRYTPLKDASGIPGVVVTLGDSLLLRTARQEMVRGIAGFTGNPPRELTEVPPEPSIVIRLTPGMPLDGYALKTEGRNILVSATNDRGALYGAFALLRKIALGESIRALDEKQSPATPVRWINHWENMDGTIERGYGGRSLWWDLDHIRSDLSRVNEYARLLASLGINACTINNVNSDPRVLQPEYLKEVAKIAEAFRPWGVQIGIAVGFGSPKAVGGLDTFDPLDPKVIAWWKAKVDEVYVAVPDLAGIVIKADSEGRVGPSSIGRTHADAANVLARALAPHHGLLFYRGFVYDNHMDWRDPKNDRARAAYDNFISLDGKFDDNVFVQVKHGPIDFQVREPASPLFGALAKANEAIELQITQEYFGQGHHTVFLIPMWKETLDFKMPTAPVSKLVKGFVGVSNVGLDENWFGNHLSQANLYGFGRLAWDPTLSSATIASEWTHLTFGDDPLVNRTITNIQLTSWRTFENYTGPLGLQTLTDIVGNHYGVAVEASERNGWGQWHNADDRGVGMDRTVATGTGFIGQYPPAVATKYESLDTCPDDLLLFMHHVPYTQKLHNGKTVIQYIYDSHYEGADGVELYVRQWKALAGHIDDERYNRVLAQLEYQAGQAQVWRDAVSNWFLRASNIPDAKVRVGHYPGRMEAESMTLDGYKVVDITPWEGASGGKAVTCAAASCVASYKYAGAAGRFDLYVEYFDMPTGVAQFKVSVAGKQVAEWSADMRVPARKLDASASTRRIIPDVALHPGDEISIEGIPNGADPAALDYVEIHLPRSN
jgi:alpha-glucuronidase